MGRLDRAFNLPLLGSDTSLNSTYALAGTDTLLNETYAKLNDTGGTGAFNRLTENAPSFAQLGSAEVTSQQITSINGSTQDTASTLQNAYKKSLAGATTSRIDARTIRQTVGDTTQSNNDYHKVKLTSLIDSSEIVIFHAMPEVAENRAVEYQPVKPPQLPGEFQKYQGTDSVQWQITGLLLAQTRDAAKQNYRFLSLLRAWTMPYFGLKQQSAKNNQLGAPPPVLSLEGWRGLVGKVPVVITSLSWNWPHEVDWLPTGIPDEQYGQEIPFPAVLNINITLKESYSANEFNQFDLQEFKAGRMISAFGNKIQQFKKVSPVAEANGGQSVIAEAKIISDFNNGEA